jgi:hypothetical protein
MEEQKTYSINGRQFKLKNSLSLAEQEMVQKPLRNFQLHGLLVAGNFKANDAVEFYSTVLIPLDGKEATSDFYLSLPEEIGVEVLADFFQWRGQSYSILIASWQMLNENFEKLKKISMDSLRSM